VGDLQTILINTCEFAEIMCVRDLETMLINPCEFPVMVCLCVRSAESSVQHL